MGLLDKLKALTVEDKHAAGTMSGQFEAMDSAAAVAQMLGVGTAALVEIGIKARGLPDKDLLSKSDAMAVIFASDNFKSKDWTEVGRTDTVANSLAPEFTKSVRARYSFERLQPMRVVIFDVDVREKDNRKLKLDQQDFLAHGHFLLSDLLTVPGRKLTLPLADRYGNQLVGCVAELSAEEMPNTNAVVELILAASKLDNKDTWGKSDPFVRIAKARHNGDWAPVLKTEVVDNDLNPTWKPFHTSMSQLCSCDEHRPLLLEVFDHDAGGSHDLIGRCQASLSQLKAAAAGGHGLALINPKKQGVVPNYTSSGMLLVKGISVTPRPSFLDYVAGGVELSFIVAIDYTASNGDPRDPSSLHHYSQRPTMYEDAISAVGRVLEHYDNDRTFPAFGFGALVPPATSVSHCFPLNGNHLNPEVAGVQGILAAYRQTLSTVKLYGPTLFAPIINTAARIASQPSARPKYHVLLILTDGAIMDMKDTLEAVVAASQLPLSLLLVGVGNEDFSAMEALDGDKKRIKAPDGRKAARDCVQFCELRPHQRDTVETLAAKLLAELPGQVVQYFHDLKRMPPPPPLASHFGVPPPPPAMPGPASSPQSAGSYPPAQSPAAAYPPTHLPASHYPSAQPNPGTYPPAQPAAAAYAAQAPADAYLSAPVSFSGYPPAQAPALSSPAQPPTAAYPPPQPPTSGYPPAQPLVGGYPPAQPPTEGAYPPAQSPATGYPGTGAYPQAGGYGYPSI